jgi:hypothetical protein
MNASLLAQLHAVVGDAAVPGENLPHVLSAIIRRCWIAQYAFLWEALGLDRVAE